MRNKIKNERSNTSKKNDIGFSLFKVETSINNSDSNNENVNFYVVPDFMKSKVQEDQSLLTSSTSCKNLYKVPLNNYKKDPERHDDAAYDMFGQFLDFKGVSAKSR